MFENAKEKRAMREANRIVSLKEDMDVVSWERVLEIGQLLQEEGGREKCAALGSELVDVAHSNLSLYSRFGIDPAPSAHVMSSGIEVLEGGLAEAALEEHRAAHVEDPVDDADDGWRDREVSVPVHPEHLFNKTRSIESLRSEQSWDELLGSSDGECQAPAFQSETEAFEPEGFPAMQDLASEPEDPADAAVEEPHEEASVVSPDPQDRASAESPEPPVTEPAPEASERRSDAESAHKRFARFRTLYESRDHSLCVFEDEHGHLIAVDSSKLA